MSYRDRNLLFAAMSFVGAGVMAWAGIVKGVGFGDHDLATVVALLLCGGIGGAIYFLILAFFPLTEPEPGYLRCIPSPEVAFEFSAGEDAEGTPSSAEAIRAALAGGTGFTVADDPAGWLVLTGTIGPPRWVKTPTGEVIGEKQFARLSLKPDTDLATVRPESLIFISTEMNLTVNTSVALSTVFRSLRIRVRGDRIWFAVGESIELFGPLAMRLIQVRPPVVSFRADPSDP